jgi:carbon monoxide dehydrogenase subunit G
MMRCCVLVCLLAFSMITVAGDNITITAERNGSAVAIDARAEIRAPLTLIWETLTDYNELARFIPGMKSSRVIERKGTAAIVRQTGEAGFLFFGFPLDVVVESLERPPHVIEIRVLSGNLRQLDGRYQIEPVKSEPGSFVLRWFGLIEPDMTLPPLIGVPILRSNIGGQFRGMVHEIERRALLQREADARDK